MTNPIPLGQDTSQFPTFPSGMLKTIYMVPIMSAKAITKAEHSVALKEVTVSPLKHPDVVLVHPKMVEV